MKKRHLKKLYKKLESLVDRILVFQGAWNVLEEREVWCLQWLGYNPDGALRSYSIRGYPKYRGKMLKTAIRDAEAGYAGVKEMDIDIISAKETRS